jgi:hypothetical protein
MVIPLAGQLCAWAATYMTDTVMIEMNIFRIDASFMMKIE